MDTENLKAGDQEQYNYFCPQVHIIYLFYKEITFYKLI